MTDQLSDGTPVTSEVASASPAVIEAPVGSPSPAAPAAPVTPASAPVPPSPGTDMVEKARLDRMQGEYQAALTRVRELERAQMSELERERSEKQELVEQLSAMQDQVRVAELSTAKNEALQKYPDIAVFGDLLWGETPEDLHALAQELQGRISTLKGGAPAPGTPAAPAPVVPVGATAPGVQAMSADDVAAAIVEAQKSGNWGDYLRAKFNRQQMQDQQ